MYLRVQSRYNFSNEKSLDCPRSESFSSHECSEKSFDWQLTACPPKEEVAASAAVSAASDRSGELDNIQWVQEFNLGTIFQMKNHSIDGGVEKVQEKFNWFKSSIPLHRGKHIYGKEIYHKGARINLIYWLF